MQGLESIKEIKRGEQTLQGGKVDEALMIFNSVLENYPDNLMAMNNKGVVLNQLKRYHQAIECFQRVLYKDKDNSTATFNLISNYFLIGNWQEIEKALEKFGHSLSKQDMEVINNDLAKLKSAGLNHPLDNIKPNNSFDFEEIQKRINKVLSKDLFFIIGVPKSGTTWMQYLLNGHPEIMCSGEGDYNIIIEGLKKIVNDYNSWIESANKNIGTSNYIVFSQENLQYLFVTAVGLLLSNIRKEQNIKCIGSKNPILIKELEVHASLIPSSKFTHIMRDGRDVMVSAWFNNLRGNEKDTRTKWTDFTSFVKFVVHQWISDINVARSFGQKYPDRYFELRYEDLHSDPDPMIRNILEFLGVDSSDSMINKCRESGLFNKLTKGRKRGSEDRSKFFRKGIIGDWKNHFDNDSLEFFMEHGGVLLGELGYEE